MSSSNIESEVKTLVTDRRFLIVDASSSRKSFRSLLSHFGVKSVNQDAVESLSDAREFIEAKKPNLIILDRDLLGKTSLPELVQYYREQIPSDQPAVLILFAQDDPGALEVTALEEGADAVLIKPFTFQILLDTFAAQVLKKFKPSPYLKSIETAKALMLAKKWDEALALASAAKKLDPAPVLACAAEGQALLGLGRNEEAVAAFEAGLKFNPKCHRCLFGLVDAYQALKQFQKAYASAKVLAETNSIPVSRIPDFVRLSVVCSSYEDVIKYYDAAHAAGKVSPELAASLAAGLVVCGIHLFREEKKDLAFGALKKAAISSPDNPKILAKIIQSYVQFGAVDDASSLVANLKAGVKKSVEIRNAELELTNATSEPQEALAYVLKQIQTGLKTEIAFEIALTRSVELGRTAQQLGELLDQAISTLPEKKEKFLKLAGQAPNQVQ